MQVIAPTFIYTGERNLVWIRNIENTYNYIDLVPTGNFAGKPSIRYYKDLNNEARIDVSLYFKDYVFAVNAINNANFTFEIRTNTGVVVGSYASRILSRLSPTFLYMPESPFLPDYATVNRYKYKLLPPTKLIGIDYETGYFDVMYNPFGDVKIRINGAEVIFNGLYSLPYNTHQTVEFWVGDDNWKAIKVLPSNPCEKYLYFFWTSQFGGKRAMLFKVKTEGWENDNIQKIITQQPYSGQIFDTKRYIVCYMDDLDAYDYWYYSDILQATDVKMHFASVEASAVNVRIEGEKKLEYPADDSGEFKTLEFKVWFN